MSPRTLLTASARNPHERIASSTSSRRSQSSMNVRKGRPASGITGIGTVKVSGLSRVPSPPARMSACTGLHADALVREPGPLETLPLEKVAAVDDERRLHPLLH